jgi:putative ABC transport system ATP-binding protein
MHDMLDPAADVAPDRDDRAGARPAVVARDLTRRFGEGDAAVDALRGASLSVAPGELVAIMGPSGSGKSTLMHVLAGLDSPTSGRAWIGDDEITAMGDNALTRLRRRRIGFIFQFFNLLPTLTAEENITLPSRIAGRRVDGAWLDEVIASVGLSQRRGHRPAEMSGGQQQRVAIARALLARPTVMFADEPTGNLDSRSSAEIQALLRRAADDYGQTTIMVTHDAHAATVADRVIFLADGRIVTSRGRSSAPEILATLAEVTR